MLISGVPRKADSQSDLSDSSIAKQGKLKGSVICFMRCHSSYDSFSFIYEDCLVKRLKN